MNARMFSDQNKGAVYGVALATAILAPTQPVTTNETTPLPMVVLFYFIALGFSGFLGAFSYRPVVNFFKVCCGQTNEFEENEEPLEEDYDLEGQASNQVFDVDALNNQDTILGHSARQTNEVRTDSAANRYRLLTPLSRVGSLMTGSVNSAEDENSHRLQN